MKLDLDLFLKTAVGAAREAGDYARKVQGSLGPAHFKGEKDLVTDADLECDRLIRARLRAAFPDHDIVTEEAEALRQGGDYCWYVDPIDGTVNYAHGLPLWGVSIGLSHENELLCGAVYLPALQELYTAVAGGGAFLNGSPLRVSAVTELSQAIISHGDFNVGSNAVEEYRRLNEINFQTLRRVAAATQRVKCMGSAVVEGTWVAAGRLEGYWMNSLWPWDVSVTALLVREAGGQVTDLQGQRWSLEKRTALFSNGTLHPALLAAIGKIATAA